MTADTVGGVWTYALELARAFDVHNVQVALATMGNPLSRDQRRGIRALTNVEVHESNYKLEWMEDPWGDVSRAGQWLLELERNVQPDVIHLNSFAHGGLPFRAPKLVVGHSCVSSWWKAVRNGEAPCEWNDYREVVRAGLQAAHMVIAPSKAMLDCLNDYYGPFLGKVIYNGRDPSLFQPGRKEEIILAAGRLWDEAKNVRALATVAPEVSWPIYVAGEAKHPNGTTLRDKHLCFLGRLPVENLSAWFSKAAIYALPARYEPFGISVLEAGLSGCVLVLGDIPSLREIWNGAALFVDPNDPDELKSTLRHMTQNLFRRKELATYAQCRAIQLTPQRMAMEYLAVYSDLLANFTPPVSQTNYPEVLCAS
ncbi:MAG: glycosyltransferase family 4 protein [Verrucomicrobia bacterium]|nr:glycosyltransferase family 4 protein [Verrucomicrobiota bacterium]